VMADGGALHLVIEALRRESAQTGAPRLRRRQPPADLVQAAHQQQRAGRMGAGVLVEIRRGFGVVGEEVAGGRREAFVEHEAEDVARRERLHHAAEAAGLGAGHVEREHPAEQDEERQRPAHVARPVLRRPPGDRHHQQGSDQQTEPLQAGRVIRPLPLRRPVGGRHLQHDREHGGQRDDGEQQRKNEAAHGRP